MKNQFQAIFIACLYLSGSYAIASGTDITLDKADPAPLGGTDFPYSYAYNNGKVALKKGKYHSGAGITISAMPFYSRANKGTDINNVKNAELGDLAGRWNMLALLDTVTPTGYTMPDILKDSSTSGSIMESLYKKSGSTETGCLAYNASSTSGSGTNYPKASTPTELTSASGLVSLQTNDEYFGYLTIPTNYRKRGTRFEATGAFDSGLGFSVEAGIASISQNANFKNAITFKSTTSQKTSSSYPYTATATAIVTPVYQKAGVDTNVDNPFSPASVSHDNWETILKCIDRELIQEFDNIADAIGLNTANFQQTGFEDLRGEVFWRKGLKLNTKNKTIFMPFVSVYGTLDLGDAADEDQPLSLPFGNNGHKSYGGGAGFTLDFNDSFEIGAAISGSSFGSRTRAGLRVPNSTKQCGIYPFKTDAIVDPGASWQVSLLMNSRNFEEDTSCYAQYVYVNHSKDSIKLINPNSGFKPEVLENKSIWSNHMVNVGMNFDASPGVSIGCVAQIPLKQKNSYRSATFGVSIVAQH